MIGLPEVREIATAICAGRRQRPAGDRYADAVARRASCCRGRNRGSCRTGKRRRFARLDVLLIGGRADVEASLLAVEDLAGTWSVGLRSPLSRGYRSTRLHLERSNSAASITSRAAHVSSNRRRVKAPRGRAGVIGGGGSFKYRAACEREIEALGGMADALQSVGDEVVQHAQAIAPSRTGRYKAGLRAGSERVGPGIKALRRPT
jgi:hypothetical protein